MIIDYNIIKNMSDEELENKMSKGEIFYCEGCNEYFDSEEDGDYFEEGDGWYSYEWLDDNLTRCEDCNKYIFDDYNDKIYIEGYGYICEHCYNIGCYGTCENCGCAFHTDDLMVDNYGDYFCNSCYEDENGGHDRRVRCYHEHKNEFTPYKLENEKNPYYIGFELEMEHKDNTTQNEAEALDILQNLNVVFEEDGSLNNSGVEVISQPQSYNYIMKNKDKIKHAFEEVVKLGYISHNSSNCGLHFHFTRPKNDKYTIQRVWLILETFKNEIKQITRRNGDDHWCKWLSDNTYEKIKALNSDYINDHKDGDRYKALNNTNTNTIEFRIFKGTLNFETFISDLQFLNNIYKLAKSNKDLCLITWDELTKGEYISKYIKEKGIKSNKIIKDYKLTIDNYNNKLYLQFEKINKLLHKNIIKQFEAIDKNEIFENIDFLNNVNRNIERYNNFQYYKNNNDLLFNLGDAVYYARELQDRISVKDNNEKIDKILDKIANIKKEVDNLCV